MEFGQDTVTKGLNIEKYSKWSLNTRMMIYKNYRSIMDKEYLQYSIRSLFFNYLVKTCKIDSLKCTVVRDEGVYKTPQEKREKIFQAYSWLTSKILELTKNKTIKNW